MKFLGWEISRVEQKATFEDVLRQIVVANETITGIAVTPDNCERSPTVKAIVQGIAKRIATLPVHVYLKTVSNGREKKEKLPDHPVARLLSRPNPWQTSVEYWLDAASRLVRWGRHIAVKGQGATGPIRELNGWDPGEVEVIRDDNLNIRYKIAGREYAFAKIHHVRNQSRDGFTGDSPVEDVKEAIAMEMAAEAFSGSYLGNGAVPGIILSFIAGSKGFANQQEADRFKEQFQDSFTGRKRFRGLVLPPGMDKPIQVPVENDKAQLIESRKYQRTVIAGAFGVPPHLVGDLERGTWNNVEQQSLDFVMQVVLPYCRMFEAAMERDLLTIEDRRAGVIIRFNLDAALRASFKDRQEGLKIQREWGVISANEWREHEGMNPIAEDDGGDDYVRPMNMSVAGEEPPEEPPEEPAGEPDDEPERE